MPLLKDEQFVTAPIPEPSVIQQLESDSVFYVPNTGEIFLTYE
jgi:hypothetical protein